MASLSLPSWWQEAGNFPSTPSSHCDCLHERWPQCDMKPPKKKDIYSILPRDEDHLTAPLHILGTLGKQFDCIPNHSIAQCQVLLERASVLWELLSGGVHPTVNAAMFRACQHLGTANWILTPQLLPGCCCNASRAPLLGDTIWLYEHHSELSPGRQSSAFTHVGKCCRLGHRPGPLLHSCSFSGWPRCWSTPPLPNHSC